MTTAIVTGIFSVVGIIVAGYFAMRGKKGETRVSEIAQILEGYKDIVHSLQSEIKRLEERIESMTAEMEACERRNAAMEREVAELRLEIKKMNKGPVKP
jgi:cell division protein FtsB